MKKLIIILFLLLSGKAVFAQLESGGWPAGIIVLTVGSQQTIMNNSSFDVWTRTNYNKTVAVNITPAGDLAYFAKHYDGGLDVSGLNGFTFISFYGGRRLTALHSKISSWLNLGI